jgi:hypothetical protein
MLHVSTEATPDELEALWEQLRHNHDPRATLPPAHRNFPLAEQKLRWAHIKLGGRRHASWSVLCPTARAYLRELLTHGRTRLDERLAAEFRAQKIGFPALYFEALKSSLRHAKLAWNYGGRTFGELNRLDKLHLLTVLRSRRG